MNVARLLRPRLARCYATTAPPLHPPSARSSGPPPDVLQHGGTYGGDGARSEGFGRPGLRGGGLNGPRGGTRGGGFGGPNLRTGATPRFGQDGNDSPAGGRGGKGRPKRRRRGQDEDDSTKSLEQRGEEEDLEKRSPDSLAFYTRSPVYYDQLSQIETAVATARSALRRLELLPMPEFARKSLPPSTIVWKTMEEMSGQFETRLRSTRYRRVVRALDELELYSRVANTAGCTRLAMGIDMVLGMFQSGKSELRAEARRKREVTLDALGRSYTVGRRKTSSARVWMIPTVHKQSEDAVEEAQTEAPPVTTSTILVNNLPLSEFFPLPIDRERITRPLKVAGVLGAYNIFTLVRGGGTTGQSDAIAHGIAKGLVVHEPQLDQILRKAQLLRRDPRMVERKKPGRAKARKGYTWVKR
ncbi:ribosomal protein S9/S16-domain-containing protein [Schizophyllum commune]